MQLLKALDQHNDMSHVVAQVPQEYLSRTVFPLGEFSKEIVYKIGESVGLKKIDYQVIFKVLKSYNNVIDF